MRRGAIVVTSSSLLLAGLVALVVALRGREARLAREVALLRGSVTALRAKAHPRLALRRELGERVQELACVSYAWAQLLSPPDFGNERLLELDQIHRERCQLAPMSFAGTRPWYEPRAEFFPW